ncbi:ATP-dependent DNA helicase PIF1-like protein [Tanacetum coccineum]
MDNCLIREALAFDTNKSKTEHQQLHALLNPKQRLIYEHILHSVYNQEGQFYFVYGPGGTGKTFLKTIMARLRSERMIVLAVASSRITSLLLPDGRMAQSRFVIPLELMENSTCGIKQNTHLAELIQQVQLIIWDEAPMTQKYAFEALDKTLRNILGRWYRAGEKKQGEDEATWIEIPERFLIKHVVQEMYLDFTTRQHDDDYLKERAILTPRNDDADAINAYMFKKLAGSTLSPTIVLTKFARPR